MTLITGNIVDTTGTAVSCNVTFRPSSDTFPYSGASGQAYSTAPIEVATDPITGFFTVQLVAGNYKVTTSSPADSYMITVPGTGSYTLDQLTTVSAPVPYVPSGNGSPEGIITAPPGYHYWDATNLTDYVKGSGTGPYGWISEVVNP